MDGYRSSIRPDIVVIKDNVNCIVLDTKWKNLDGYNPSPDDLRQMYVYHEYYKAKKVALVYPGSKSSTQKKGNYLNPETKKKTEKECSIIPLSVNSNIKQWQESIYKEVETWMNSTL